MLEKIYNITPNADFNSPKNHSSFDLLIQRQFRENSHRNDSINFSPALLYLKQINWKLNQFKVLSSKKVYCSFDVLNFQIDTVVDAMPATPLSEIYYNITEKNSVHHRLYSASFKILLKKDDIEKDEMTKLNYLSAFFGRIYSLTIDKELNSSDSEAVAGLLEGMLNGLYNEFCYINFHLLKFIEKMISIKMLISEKNHYQKIFLNSIKTLN